MLKRVTMVLALLAIFATASMAQWNNVGAWPSGDLLGSTHGLAVDPDGKVWVSNYYSDETIVDINTGDTVLVGSIKVFNPDGTEADFSPIKVAKLSEFESDTLYGNCRGMRTDIDGNILYVQSGPTMMYEFDYETGEAVNAVDPELGTSPTAPAVSEDGTIFIGPVVPGNPLKMFDQDFNFVGNALESTVGFSRAFEVSDDGNTIYWAGYTNGAVYVYERPDQFSAFDSVDTILEGFASESFAWHPTTGNLWASAGSGNDPAGMGYSNHTWYAYNPSTGEVVDEMHWSFVEGVDSANQRPRAIDFSPDGETAYVGSFGTNDLPMMQKLVKGEAPGATVEFNVDMSGQAFVGNFDPATDTVEVRGSFNGWGGDMMTDDDNDSVYTYTYSDAAVGDTIMFKFWHSPDVWEGVADRQLVVDAQNVVFTAFFNNDTILSAPKDLQITYRANMEVERLSGRFDPATDTVEIRGEYFGWGPGVVMEQSGLDQDIFFHTATQNVAAGQSIPPYKFWYSPDNWEAGDNRSHTVTLEEWNSGSITIERPFNDAGIEDVTGQESEVLFTVNTEGATSSVTGQEFPAVNTVHIFGSTDPLNWPAGGWPDEDIDQGIQLYDDGTNGDETADDNVFSANVTFSAYTPFQVEYKYGINYGDADNNEGGNDNEAGVGDNHVIYLQKDLLSAKVENTFGVMGEHNLVDVVVGVEEVEGQTPKDYTLGQNYPNPFNPTTNIRFTIPESGIVTMKIYNTLGEQVATLMQEQKSAGTYNVSFNAANLPSGVYIYQIQVNDFTASKKMMLMK